MYYLVSIPSGVRSNSRLITLPYLQFADQRAHAIGHMAARAKEIRQIVIRFPVAKHAAISLPPAESFFSSQSPS